MILNIIIIMIFVLFSIFLFKKSKEYFPFLILMWFVHFWMLVSVAYLERGCTIRYHMTTYFTGATLRLFLYEIIFFTSMLITIKLMHKNNKNINKDKNKTIKNIPTKNKLWLGIIGFCTILLFVDVIISPNKLTSSLVTRFDYYKNFSKLSSITYYISLFIDYLYCIVRYNIF